MSLILLEFFEFKSIWIVSVRHETDNLEVQTMLELLCIDWLNLNMTVMSHPL